MGSNLIFLVYRKKTVLLDIKTYCNVSSGKKANYLSFYLFT